MASLLYVFNSLFNYYKSFWNIFYLRNTPENPCELYHWTLYQYFIHYEKRKLNYRHKLLTFCFYGQYFSKLLINRWIIIIIWCLLGPLISIILAIFVDKVFIQCIDNPCHYWYFIRWVTIAPIDKTLHKVKIMFKYNVSLPPLPVNPAYIYFVWLHTKNDDLCLANKHCLYRLCQKYSIPTVKCLMTIDELKQYKSENENAKEFIVKGSDLGVGVGMILTTDPESYLSKIPDVVIQPRLRNHKQITNVTGNRKTLCTFRVVTYTKEINLKPEAWLSVAMNEDSLTDHDVSACYIYDIDTKLFTKRIDSEFPMIIASKDVKDIHEFKIDGLTEFILYLSDVHQKYVNDLIAIGWDVTKISNGDWIIVECNARAGFYYSKIEYEQKIVQTYIQRIAQFTKSN